METCVNNKCKAFTSLEQSKILAEILPIESADMYYQYVLPKSDKVKHNPEIGNPINALEWYNKGYTMSGKEPITMNEYCVPCWSLTALLGLLPKRGAEEPMIRKLYYASEPKERYICEYSVTDMTSEYDNPVDACVDMILLLKERSLI